MTSKQNDHQKMQVSMLQKNLQEPRINREMEAPVIVKSIGRGITSMREDIMDRAISNTPQSVSNRAAYDIMYPTHESYYNDKKYFVFDENFEKVEKVLINSFEKAVNEGLTDPKVKPNHKGYINNIEHVDEIKDTNLKFDFDKVPRVY